MIYRGYVYSPPEHEMTDATFSGYCVQASCYNNVVNNNSTFTSDLCNSSYCEVEKTLVPTLPDIDDNHWFFDYFLYIGGVIHLWMSLTMTISYFLINARNFVLPGFIQYLSINRAKSFLPNSVYQFMYRKLDRAKGFLPNSVYQFMYVKLKHCNKL